MPGESLHAGIIRWACQADRTLLALLAGIGTTGTLVIMLVDWRVWPAAGMLLSVGMVGSWGLVDQQAGSPHSRLVRVVAALLATIGGGAAALAALGILFWLLGPAPIL